MIMPNTMCRPPNPAAMSQLPHAAGPNSAMAPTSMKQIPITGTTRTENAPPVTNPVPYKSSQVPGSACHKPARYSATVSKPPTTMGGRKLRPKRRPGPERMGSAMVRKAYAVHERHDGLAQPGSEPQLGRGLAGREERGGERRGSDRHLAPARDRGKRSRALHRLPDEAEVVERTVVQRPRSDHDTHTMARRPAVVKYFVIQSKAG